MNTAERRAAMRQRILAVLRERGPLGLAPLANLVGDKPGRDGSWRPSMLAPAGDVWDRLDELQADGLVDRRDVGLGRPMEWGIAADAPDML